MLHSSKHHTETVATLFHVLRIQGDILYTFKGSFSLSRLNLLSIPIQPPFATLLPHFFRPFTTILSYTHLISFSTPGIFFIHDFFLLFFFASHISVQFRLKVHNTIRQTSQISECQNKDALSCPPKWHSYIIEKYEDGTKKRDHMRITSYLTNIHWL